MVLSATKLIQYTCDPNKKNHNLHNLVQWSKLIDKGGNPKYHFITDGAVTDFVTANSKMAAKKSQEQIVAGFQELRQQQRQIVGKVADIEMDMKEHEYDLILSTFFAKLLMYIAMCFKSILIRIIKFGRDH